MWLYFSFWRLFIKIYGFFHPKDHILLEGNMPWSVFVFLVFKMQCDSIGTEVSAITLEMFNRI